MDSPFLKACRGEAVDRVPVWILRQAGRFLPQYREVRGRFPDFLEFVRNPEACAEVTCQPPAILGVDAAILFSDILTVLPPLGFDLAFREGEGPRIANPLRAGDGRKLSPFDPARELSYVMDAVRACRRSLPVDLPLIGFAGAPWTVACYAVDGGGSKEFSRTRGWLHADPVGFSMVLEALADTTADYLAAQAEAGCQVLQVFESWGGLLSPTDYRRVVVPVLQRLLARLRERTELPVIVYCNGGSTLLKELLVLDCQVLAFDWRIEMKDARAIAGSRPLQGNFDPCLLHAPHGDIARRVREVAAQSKGGPWIANLGHGIQPDAPVEGLKALIDAVHAIDPRSLS
ncbi:MAG TPA: uroporphyrinogen decarboxylase [Fibrobacteria bacterium]|nr:uroporphyrinogen decarboxylase [Fibrobacteria bacterium]HOX51491.1 uroporphyrinogen decarboxylase [Fibrobacteria bacterium]